MTLRVAIVTPYYQESPDLLSDCFNSVAIQTHPCRHIFVADGFPNSLLDGFPVDHLKLPQPHFDIGSTPRLIGAIHAMSLGYDVILFLDADNWYLPDHVSSVVHCMLNTSAVFVSTSRALHRPDGSFFSGCPNTDPDHFIDTNCMAFGSAAFSILFNWVLMPSYAHLIGDRVILHHVLKSGLPRHHLDQPTVAYRCGKAGIYRQLGMPIPPGVSEPPDYSSAFRRWSSDGYPELL